MTLGDAIRAALLIAEPRAKVMAAREVARDWRLGRLQFAFERPMPDRPARPSEPELLPPNRMPKRKKGGSERNRIPLWHSLAHIEFVAIDLALDMAGRFGGERGPAFVSDFLSVAADEASVDDESVDSVGEGVGVGWTETAGTNACATLGVTAVSTTLCEVAILSTWRR